MPAVSQALSIYETIRTRIIALDPSIDETTLADTLEGLTDLNEIVTSVVRGALLDEAHAAGIKSHIQVLDERLKRLVERSAKRRQIARDAMLEVDIKKIAAPDFTLFVRPGPASLVVTDEKSIPAPFWQPREPRLDRLALLAELKHGATIPGVSLSDPEPVLSVRVR